MQRIQSPRADDDAIEQEIKAKGLTAARVTPEDMAANIAREHFFTAAQGVLGALVDGANPQHDIWLTPGSPLSLMTFCVLELKNGFIVTGESACASPENFNAELGQKIARDNARNKIWALEGYLLRSQLAA